MLSIREEPDKWRLPQALADRDGNIHLFFLRFRKGDPYDHEAGETDKVKAREVSEQHCIDVWHSRTRENADACDDPRRIWIGYTGSLMSALQMGNGRILLPFSYWVDKTWRNRGNSLEDFTYWGYRRITLMYSDDAGENWHVGDTPPE